MKFIIYLISFTTSTFLCSSIFAVNFLRLVPNTWNMLTRERDVEEQAGENLFYIWIKCLVSSLNLVVFISVSLLSWRILQLRGDCWSWSKGKSVMKTIVEMQKLRRKKVFATSSCVYCLKILQCIILLNSPQIVPLNSPQKLKTSKILKNLYPLWTFQKLNKSLNTSTLSSHFPHFPQIFKLLLLLLKSFAYKR